MDTQPNAGLEREGLSCCLLRLAQDDRKIEQLREELSGFTHRCRNLLSGVKMSLYFVRRGADRPLPAWWAEVEQNYEGIERLLDQLQQIYRPMPLTLVRAPLRSFVLDRERTWREWFTSSNGSLQIMPPAEESTGELDPMYLSLGFDAMLRWRASALLPGHFARFSWMTTESRLEACWHEVRTEGRAEQGEEHHPRPDRSASASPHQVLALPLLARVIKAHQGTMQWRSAPEFEVVFGWPLDQSKKSPALTSKHGCA
jgi:hypothetical protein